MNNNSKRILALVITIIMLIPVFSVAAENSEIESINNENVLYLTGSNLTKADYTLKYNFKDSNLKLEDISYSASVRKPANQDAGTDPEVKLTAEGLEMSYQLLTASTADNTKAALKNENEAQLFLYLNLPNAVPTGTVEDVIHISYTIKKNPEDQVQLFPTNSSGSGAAMIQHNQNAASGAWSIIPYYKVSGQRYATYSPATKPTEDDSFKVDIYVDRNANGLSQLYIDGNKFTSYYDDPNRDDDGTENGAVHCDKYIFEYKSISFRVTPTLAYYNTNTYSDHKTKLIIEDFSITSVFDDIEEKIEALDIVTDKEEKEKQARAIMEEIAVYTSRGYSSSRIENYSKLTECLTADNFKNLVIDEKGVTFTYFGDDNTLKANIVLQDENGIDVDFKVERNEESVTIVPLVEGGFAGKRLSFKINKDFTGLPQDIEEEIYITYSAENIKLTREKVTFETTVPDTITEGELKACVIVTDDLGNPVTNKSATITDGKVEVVFEERLKTGENYKVTISKDILKTTEDVVEQFLLQLVIEKAGYTTVYDFKSEDINLADVVYSVATRMSDNKAIEGQSPDVVINEKGLTVKYQLLEQTDADEDDGEYATEAEKFSIDFDLGSIIAKGNIDDVLHINYKVNKNTENVLSLIGIDQQGSMTEIVQNLSNNEAGVWSKFNHYLGNYSNSGAYVPQYSNPAKTKPTADEFFEVDIYIDKKENGLARLFIDGVEAQLYFNPLTNTAERDTLKGVHIPALYLKDFAKLRFQTSVNLTYLNDQEKYGTPYDGHETSVVFEKFSITSVFDEFEDRIETLTNLESAEERKNQAKVIFEDMEEYLIKGHSDDQIENFEKLVAYLADENFNNFVIDTNGISFTYFGDAQELKKNITVVDADENNVEIKVEKLGKTVTVIPQVSGGFVGKKFTFTINQGFEGLTEAIVKEVYAVYTTDNHIISGNKLQFTTTIPTMTENEIKNNIKLFSEDGKIIDFTSATMTDNLVEITLNQNVERKTNYIISYNKEILKTEKDINKVISVGAEKAEDYIYDGVRLSGKSETKTGSDLNLKAIITNYSNEDKNVRVMVITYNQGAFEGVEVIKDGLFSAGEVIQTEKVYTNADSAEIIVIDETSILANKGTKINKMYIDATSGKVVVEGMATKGNDVKNVAVFMANSDIKQLGVDNSVKGYIINIQVPRLLDTDTTKDYEFKTEFYYEDAENTAPEKYSVAVPSEVTTDGVEFETVHEFMYVYNLEPYVTELKTANTTYEKIKENAQSFGTDIVLPSKDTELFKKIITDNANTLRATIEDEDDAKKVIIAAVARAELLYGLKHNTINVVDVEKKLIEYETDAQLNLSAFKALNGKKTDVCTQFISADYMSTGYNQFVTMFNSAVDAAKQTSGTGAGGGTGGGGGSFIAGGSGGQYVDDTEADKDNVLEFDNKNLYTDLADFGWAQTAINHLSRRGVISGIGDGKFNPSGNVTREQMVKMIVIAFDLFDPMAETEFEDVPMGDWSYKYIASAEKSGLINGISDNQFGYGMEVSREDAALMLYRVCVAKGRSFKTKKTGFTDEELISDYAKEAVEYMSGAGIINGFEDNTFRPQTSANRAQAAMLVYWVTGGNK